jgi:glycosyltransferase involved in cell wall biosynthesis
VITVLHVIESLGGYGGTPRKLLYLAKHHDRSRVNLWFMTYQNSEFLPEFRRHGATVCEINSLSVWRIARQVAEVARRSNADVICTHFTRSLVVGYLAAEYLDLPFIHCEHSSAQYRKGIARRLTRYCISRAAAVICNSFHTARTIMAEYQISQDRLHVLYNPVENRECQCGRDAMRVRLNAGPNDFVIGHVGGMIATRDQGTLIRAFHEVHRIHENTRLIMIGDGPLRGGVENLVRDSGLSEAVQIVGYTEYVGDYLGAIDIYVNPTLDEGFGIAVVEAMLAELPVVCANAGAHPELITDGQHGLLYKAGDVTALSNALMALIHNPEQRRRMGVVAANSARQRFAPELYARGFEDIAKHVVVNHDNRVVSVSRSTE